MGLETTREHNKEKDLLKLEPTCSSSPLSLLSSGASFTKDSKEMKLSFISLQFNPVTGTVEKEKKAFFPTSFNSFPCRDDDHLLQQLCNSKRHKKMENALYFPSY
jgi:hypothetical protein